MDGWLIGKSMVCRIPLSGAYLAFCLRDAYLVNTFHRLLEWRGSQVVRPGTANPLFAGSIPARASILP